MHGALLDALSQMLAGRFLRARANGRVGIIAQAGALDDAKHRSPHGTQLRTLAHLVAAEARTPCRTRARARHICSRRWIRFPNARGPMLELREGAQCAPHRWSFDDAMPACAGAPGHPARGNGPAHPGAACPAQGRAHVAPDRAGPGDRACWASTTRSRRWPLKA